jgi:hypothetical protein
MEKFLAVLGTSVLASSIVALSPTVANAAFVGVTCAADVSVTYGGASETACTGSYEGNLTPVQATNLLNGTGTATLSGNVVPNTTIDGGVNGLPFGNITDWVFDRKINTSSTGGTIEDGANLLGFLITPATGTTSGQWGFTNTSYTGPIALELKGSTFLSYYFFNSIQGAVTALGQWQMGGVAQGDIKRRGEIIGLNPNQLPGLSHASLFYSASAYPDDPESVPEPLTILGTVLGGGAAWRMRKKLMDSAKA